MIIKIFEIEQDIVLDMGGDQYRMTNVHAYRIGLLLMDRAIASCSRASDDLKRLATEQLEIAL